ncbi:MAG: T9SS type A sorting domain-containing protein [Bacteroidota bacterium]
MKFAYLILLIVLPHCYVAQCVDCGNGIIDAGETSINCPEDIAHGASCTSPCNQPTSFEANSGLRVSFDFVGTQGFVSTGLPAGWAFAGAPSATTAGALPAADVFGLKAGLVQPNCSGSCAGTNFFCIGNLANSVAVGGSGTSGKLGANFDGRANVAANLSYAILRGQNNPTLVSQTFNNSAVEGFKIQFWLAASETSCGLSGGWGSCTGNTSFLDFSSDGGTTWVQIMQMNNSSTNTDMCINNSTNTMWLAEGRWGRVCLTVFKNATSAGNFYPAAKAGTAASGMMLDNRWFTSSFKYRIRYSQSASCTSATASNPGRYLAIDYPVFTSGSEMIPCGISFSKMCGYGEDNNDDGVGSSATTSTIVFSTVKRSVNNAERGVEILTSQTSAYASQNLTGSSFATNYDLCNAEGGDAQCIDWRTSNGFYTAVYECIADWEAASGTGINLQYYKGTTPQSIGMTKVTTAGKTAVIGWRYSANRFVSCSSLSDLNPGCNGYSFLSGSLPTQFNRGFYALATNSLGEGWSFYGATSCSHYFNGPFFAPIATPDTIASGAGNYVICDEGVPVFTGLVDYCSDGSGFTGSAQLTITGPNGFIETISSGAVGVAPIVDQGTYTIQATTPTTPTQCKDCGRSVCVTVTATDLDICSAILPIELINFDANCVNNTIVLNWCTASEKNNQYFTIDQSTNGIDFKSVAKVFGNGTTTQQQCYQTMVNAVADPTYFRLKQTDYNGDNKTFKIIATHSCSETKDNIKLTNNGTRSLRVSLNSESAQKLQLHLYNSLGQLVDNQYIEIQQGNNHVSVNLDNTGVGLYYVSVSNAEEKLISEKLMITDFDN